MQHMRVSFFAIAMSFWALIPLASPVNAAADRAKVEEFLEITGFDVALASIRLSAASAPVMLGIDANAFGSEWTRLTNSVFKTDVMHNMAVDILEQALTEPLLDHAAEFYASPFGVRIVAAENRSHMIEDEDAKSEAGDMIVGALTQAGAERLDELQRMTRAVGSIESSVRALQEIQFRFLMAAAGAGVIEFQMEGEDLRQMLALQEESLKEAIAQSSLSGAAYTYQAFSDEEITQYADALEHPDMREVYTLMNAVQYEVMANRFEALADAMAGLQPSTDL